MFTGRFWRMGCGSPDAPTYGSVIHRTLLAYGGVVRRTLLAYGSVIHRTLLAYGISRVDTPIGPSLGYPIRQELTSDRSWSHQELAIS